MAISPYLKFRSPIRTSNQINKDNRYARAILILEKSSEENPQKPFKRLHPNSKAFNGSLFTLPKVEDILMLLKNGKWHDLKEIGEKTQLNNLKVKSVTKFLSQYNFIKLNEGEQKIKLDPSMKKFLKKIRQLEGEETL